jgi:hypothetical protein
MSMGMGIWQKTAVLFFALSTAAPRASASEHNTYNTYRFNRANYDMGLPVEDRGNWYEWWYYKVITDDGTPFFWIYGVINPWDHEHSNPATRAYVTMGNFATKEIIEKPLSLNNFEAAYNRTLVKVGDTVATDKNLSGHLQDKDGGEVSWNLQLEKEWGWNAMGWGLPFNNLLDISWFPAQASARMSGSIDYKGKHYDLKNRPAYQDRNWGRGFPNWWFWLVSNEFVEDTSAVLACGGGLPKFLGQEVMPSLNCSLKVGTEEYAFRSTDLNEYSYDISFGRWDLWLKSLTKKIHVYATAPKHKFMDLQFLSPEGTVFHDYETLTGDMTVDFYSFGLFTGWHLDKHLTTNRSGIEYGSENVESLEEAKSSFVR